MLTVNCDYVTVEKTTKTPANVLPTDMCRVFINIDPLSTFKRELDDLLTTVPHEPTTIPGLIRCAK